MNDRYKKITVDFSTYNEDLATQYEKGVEHGRFFFLNSLRKLIEGPGNGTDLQEEIRDFILEFNIHGAERVFVEKLILLTVRKT